MLTYEELIENFRQPGSGEALEKLLIAINVGMWEEWDCDLIRGVLLHGFGGKELELAARGAPKDILWEDDNLNDFIETDGDIDDLDNRYTVHVSVHVKNAGPVKDMEYDEVRNMLVDVVGGAAKAIRSAPWVLEVDVK